MIHTRKKIVAFRGDQGACWFYRLHSPMTYLGKNNADKYEISVTGTIQNTHCRDFDLVILQRQYAKDVYEAALRMKQSGTKLVYEVDDNLFNVPEWNGAHDLFNKPGIQHGIKEFLSIVDAMFVTTETLKETYSKYCKKIYVLPNSINYDAIYPTSKYNQKKEVICWQGSLTHERDVQVISKCLKRLAQNDDVVLKMWSGFKERTSLNDNRDPIFDIPGSETLQLVPFDAFFQMFAQVGTSIGLAPLAANPFNKCKSNLKFLEYTALDAVTVASDFGPYGATIEDGVTGILISDNSTWYDAVYELVHDKEMYNYLLKNAKEFVYEKYNIERNYKQWQDAIEEVLTTT